MNVSHSRSRLKSTAGMATVIAAFYAATVPLDGSQRSAASGLRARSVRVAGVLRSYLLYVPRGFSTDQALPVVLMFHGGGSDARGQVALSQMNGPADAKGFLVIYPQGTGPLPRTRTFNAGICCGSSVRNGIDDVAFAMAALDDVAREFRVDPRRVYASGMSNGAMMAYRLACERPDRIAAIAVVAGSMVPGTCHPGQPVPILHFHGSADRFVPYGGGVSRGVSYPPVTAVVAFWVANNRCSSSPHTEFQRGDTECQTYEPCASGAAVTLCTTRGGGHTWPGGPRVPFLGTTTRDISATDRMATFFGNYVKSSASVAPPR